MENLRKGKRRGRHRRKAKSYDNFKAASARPQAAEIVEAPLNPGKDRRGAERKEQKNILNSEPGKTGVLLCKLWKRALSSSG